MASKRYSSFLTIILIVAILGVLVLLGFLGYDIYRKKAINASAEKAVRELDEEIESMEKNSNTQLGDSTTELKNTTFGSDSTGKTVKKYKGYDMYGTLKISKTDVALPILEYTAGALEIGCCLQVGVGLNEVGNNVIVGHNYRNGILFSNNKNLAQGDIITVTDLNGLTVNYSIYQIFETTPTDAEYTNRNTTGKREISLSTCTDDGNMRLVILAKEQ